MKNDIQWIIGILFFLFGPAIAIMNARKLLILN